MIQKHLARTAALLGILAPAFAQEPNPRSDRVVYDAAFYDSFTPRTALDMIRQTPGFVLEAEDQERRGFAGAVGNVLIDGQRLGAKSQSLQDVLGRVAAREVLRIEVLRGSAVAGDASGAAVLANVVRTPTSAGGTWETGFELTNEDQPMPNGKFGWSGRREATEYSLGGSAFTHDHVSAGWFDMADGEGNALGRKRDAFPHRNGDYALNGQTTFGAGEGRLTVTGQVSYFRHDENFTQLIVTPLGEQSAFKDIPYSERSRTGEAGLTWQTPVRGWDLTLTALATRRFNRWHTTATEFGADDMQQRESFQQVRTDSGESILRGTFARNVDTGRLEFGAEAAVNTLDGAQLLTVDEGSGAQPVLLPNANLSIEETRAEGFVSHAWSLNERWSLDSRLAAETSRLSFTGDTDQSVSLTYLKPRVQLTRLLGKHQVQMRWYRDVGQLDFNDFVTTAAFGNDLIEGGNPDLRPQTSWAVEMEGDFRFANDSAFRLRLFKHFVREVVDFVPVGTPGNQFDAPGNIGDGSMIGAETSLRVPLGKLLPGGSLSLSALWQDTAVDDPLTGRTRPFSDFSENSIDAELRQDLQAARFAWGATYHAESMDADFRFNEVFRFREIHQLNLFAETTWIPNLKLRVELQSALDSPERRIRRFYSPDRNGALTRTEMGEFKPGHWWLMTLSSTF